MAILTPLRYSILVLGLAVSFFGCHDTPRTGANARLYEEPHRPQLHFSPKAHWMNDPNGLVFANGTYHLFYQFYPDSNVWGPMHWGHAISSDLVHWQHMPTALAPDKLGYIFSGSAVMDSANTAGFNKGNKVAMVAIFTHHDPKGEKAGRTDYQKQSLAYSLDEGETWTKYPGNPVLPNPGNRKDFRDPKVFWYAEGKKWMMSLAVHDHIEFYSSPDLKTWTHEGEFGQGIGAHGGVWECPDLFPMTCEGKTIWVLLVSINPGGPYGGSATQYFTGNFDGHRFTAAHTDTRWLDFGPDNYAGVTWNGTGSRRVFIGWMSNWLYGQQVPTDRWRGAMTLPRELTLQRVKGQYRLSQEPLTGGNTAILKGWRQNDTAGAATPTIMPDSVGEDAVQDDEISEEDYFYPDFVGEVNIHEYSLTDRISQLRNPVRIQMRAPERKSFTISFFTSDGVEMIAGYDQVKNRYYIDRSRSGKVDFQKDFIKTAYAPCLSPGKKLDVTFVLDNSSLELFADSGLTAMTATYFSVEPFTDIQLTSPERYRVDLRTLEMGTIWKGGYRVE